MHRRTVRGIAASLALAWLPATLIVSHSQRAGGVGAPAAPAAVRAVSGPAGPLFRPTARVAARPGPARPTTPGGPTWPDGIPRTPITVMPPAGRTVTLTFDDGPDPRWTPAVLTLLRQYHAQAVFCLVGEHVAARPDLVRRTARAGHVLCDHTWTHDEYLARRPLAVIHREIDRTATAIHRAAGVWPVYYRAPGGNWGSSVLSVARADGLAPLGWQVDPSDWARPGTAAIVARVLAGVRPGAVVLLHDGYGNREQTVAALRVILARLSARGYHFTVPR
jgi:peptidoglycan/xylan/chitin deacetylase (PgdA/CDA1 family)